MVVSKNLEIDLGDFADRYNALRSHVAIVHRDATAGAAAADGGLLTDHGPEHIQMVIDRASQLSNSGKCDLTDYEAFLLLAAIHLHDVGNIHGRAGHQFKAADVAEWLGPSISRDAIERRQIVLIASAHTAGKSKDKDTIEKLPPQVHILNHLVRPRLLASILRFADELAEDRSRASRYLYETETLPPGSEIYHAYAYALHSVVIDHDYREVQLHFEIDRDVAVRKLSKNKTTAFLLDEILLRSEKMHRERAYAMQFMRDWIPIDAIRIFIEVYGAGMDAVEKIGYRLASRGYPDKPPQGVYAVAPELSNYRDWGGAKVDGEMLARRLGEGSKDERVA